jgi:2-oxoglutarate ferredoxin oxidoreductase subunit beta
MTERSEITAEYASGEVIEVEQHDGTFLRLRKVDTSYDPSKRYDALSYMNDHHERGEIVTGLLYLDPLALDLHASLNTSHLPLNTLSEKELCPGAKILSKINDSLR